MNNSEIANSFEKLIAERVKILEKLSSVDDESLRKKPAADKWSALETLHHIYLVEAGIINEIQEALDSESAKEKDLFNPVRAFLFKLFFLLPLKVKAPIKAILPKQGVTLEEIKNNWIQLHSESKHTFEQFPLGKSNLTLFTHPVFGALTALQSVTLLIKHTRRHQKQIEGALSSTD